MSAPRVVRTRTVLFTDLVDSTALFSRAGEDASAALRARHFGCLREALRTHDGHEIKNLGDGVMATFESATDAVACAVAMQRAVEADARRGGAVGMAIRVGLSTGDVVLDEGDCFGEAVTEASRLCAAAGAGTILVADVVRELLRGRGGHVLRPAGSLTLKGLPQPVVAHEVDWSPGSGRTLRAVVADDAVLLREGLCLLLEGSNIEVVAQAGDADGLLAAVAEHLPDVVVTDVRMPPTHTVEGIEAAEAIRENHPGVAVLVLSQHLDRPAADRLRRSGGGGVGYLLKERIGDVEQFARAVRSVAGGGTELDPLLADGPGPAAAQPARR